MNPISSLPAIVLGGVAGQLIWKFFHPDWTLIDAAIGLFFGTLFAMFLVWLLP